MSKTKRDNIKSPTGRWMARRAFTIGAAFALSGASASAEDFGGALETALRTSPDLQAQYESLRGLNESVSSARAGLRPTVSGSGSSGYSYSQSSESQRNSHLRPSTLTLSASQPIFDGFQTENAVASAFENVRSGRETLRQTEQTVLLNAISAYIGVVQANENLALAKNDLRVNQRSLQAARDRFNVGEVTRTDVAQAEAALAESSANLATRQGQLRQARETYLRQVGVLPGELEPLPPLPDLPKTLEEAREIARRQHPTILAAMASVSSAGFSVEQARGALLAAGGSAGLRHHRVGDRQSGLRNDRRQRHGQRHRSLLPGRRSAQQHSHQSGA